MYQGDCEPKQSLSPLMPRQLSLSERLIEERGMLQDRIMALDAALKAMKENPAVRDTVDAIAKLGRINF